MFTSIDQGLQVYNDTVKSYLKKRKELHDLYKMGRQACGADHAGSLDWGKEDWEWRVNTGHQMHGMAMALGLSKKESDDVWEKYL